MDWRPCKFQMEATGQNIMVYDEAREHTAFATEPDHVKTIATELELTPLSEAYAMAKLHDDGVIEIGQRLPEQVW